MAIDFLGELRALRGLISYEGVTTADGAGGGGTLVCSDLTLRPDYDGNVIVITSGALIGQARDIDGATNLGTVTPTAVFGGQIVAGVEFIIVALRMSIAEVAEIEEKLDLPAADSALAATIAQVVGNKASTAVYAKDNVSDIIRYLKGILDANISASGVADAGSGVGLIRDAARTEANDWWNGQTILMLTGAAAGQKRPITDFLAATDDIIVAPDFDAAPGAGDVYVILAHYNLIVPRAADSALNALTSQVVGRKDDTAVNTVSNTASAIRYLKGLLISLGHVDKFTGEQWFVSTAGNDANSGRSPDDPFLTIVHAVSVVADGDRITVMAGTYDEAGLDLDHDGLELVCEQGTIISNSTPGTVLVVSADYCRVVGAIFLQAGQTGLQITGNFCSIENCLAFACDIGFDDDGGETHMTDCRSLQHTTTGFAISGSYGEHERLIAVGAGAFRGIHLDGITADYNHFKNCHTIGNTIAGWEVIAGAANNVFANCTTGGGDGAKVDPGAPNTWANFAEGSQIVAGQTRDQDLKDIYDRLGATLIGILQIAATIIDLDQLAATYDLFTGTTEVVILEALNIKMPTGAAGGALTSISIQTDDATPGVILDSTVGDVANLTSEADLAWTGSLYITVGTKIRLTIDGGATVAGYICQVTAKYRAVVSGGYLA